MKRNNYIILSVLTLASALVLSSCSKDEDEILSNSTAMDNTITVNAMVGSNVATKAFAAEQSTTADALQSISLSAWNESTAAISNATYTKTNDKWSTSGLYYWATGAYTFIAWANNNAAATATGILGNAAVEGTSQVSGTYTVERSVTDGSNPTAAQNDPVLAVATYAAKPDDNAVDLQFQHLLSRISINVYAPLFTENTVCLLDFGFKGVSTSGTFTYNTTTATTSAFAPSCWSQTQAGNVGEWADSEDSNANYWWPAYNNSSAATLLTADNASTYGASYAPIVPKAMDTNFPKLTAYYTTDENVKTAVTSAPWLNVIPGSNLADQLQIRLNILQKEGEETTATWKVKTLKVSLADVMVGSEALTEYKPGYQYVYNIRIVGQNTDDAEVSEAEVTVQDVTVTPWNPESIAQQNSTNIGIGNSLQMLVDQIAASGGYGTIKLTENVVLDQTVTIPDGCNISIDLAGYSITTKQGTTVDPLFEVEKGGELTFEDTDTNASGSVTAAENTSIIKLEDGDGSKDGGKVTINGGKFYVLGDTGYVIESTDNEYHGTSAINGGTINKTSYTGDNSSPLSGDGTSINGGTFTGGFQPTAPEGYTAIKVGDEYVIVPSAQVLTTSNTGSGSVIAD